MKETLYRYHSLPTQDILPKSITITSNRIPAIMSNGVKIKIKNVYANIYIHLVHSATLKTECSSGCPISAKKQLE